MDKTTTDSTGRLTKQGLRDLNTYGPRPVKSVEGAPTPELASANDTGPGAAPPLTAAVKTPE